MDPDKNAQISIALAGAAAAIVEAIAAVEATPVEPHEELRQEVRDLVKQVESLETAFNDANIDDINDIDERLKSVESSIEDLDTDSIGDVISEFPDVKSKVDDMPDMSGVPEDTGDRLDALESKVEDLENSVGKLEELEGLDVETLSTAEDTIRGFERELSDIREEIRPVVEDHAKTDWDAISGLAARVTALEKMAINKPLEPDRNTSLSEMFLALSKITAEIGARFASNEKDACRLP